MTVTSEKRPQVTEDVHQLIVIGACVGAIGVVASVLTLAFILILRALLRKHAMPETDPTG